MPARPVINQLCFPERHFSANCISLRLSEVQMKFYERSLQALLSSALAASPLAREFSRVLARLASLAQIGELARRLTLKMTTALSTSLFRTTFTWTIILNLLMKRLLGSNLSHFWNHYQRKEKHFGLNSLFVSTVANRDGDKEHSIIYSNLTTDTEHLFFISDRYLQKAW